MIGPNERWGSDFFVLFFPELPLNPSGKFWAEACCLAPAEDWPGIFFPLRKWHKITVLLRESLLYER
jgi:hypothetical protein